MNTNIRVDLIRMSRAKWRADIAMTFSRGGLTAYKAVAVSPEQATAEVVAEWFRNERRD